MSLERAVCGTNTTQFDPQVTFKGHKNALSMTFLLDG